MAKTNDFRVQGNTGPHGRMRPIPESELETCILEGLTVKQATARLALCGVAISTRTVARRMGAWRKEQSRLRVFRQIGVGLGSVHADLGALTATMQVAAPEWRGKCVEQLRIAFESLLNDPTAEKFTSVVAGSYSLMVASNLEKLFEGMEDA
jgi:hypothetical protein